MYCLTALTLGGHKPQMPTRLQFLKLVRAAGWQKVAGSHSTYASPNGTRFQPDGYFEGKGILWRWYAGRGELPQEIPGDGFRQVGYEVDSGTENKTCLQED